MPIWLTVAELESDWGADRIQRLADRDGDGEPDAGAVAAKIEEAEGRVKSRLTARRYPADLLPTIPGNASKALKRVVSKLAFSALHDLHDALSSAAIQAEATGVSELNDLCSGEASLLLADDPAVDNVRPTIHRSSRRPDSAVSQKGAFARHVLENF